MTLRVVGAGVGRTGTMSLKLALEKLLDGPCYHMMEVFVRPEHVTMWQSAMDGDLPDWEQLYDGFAGAVDWPTCTFWRELADEYPDAPILLSTRDADSWWRSCDQTIFNVFRGDGPPGMDAWLKMGTDMMQRFAPNFLDEDDAKAAFVRHNDEVRATIAPSRLIEWRPGDDWGLLCEGLGLPVPDEPYPHANTTAEFRGRAGWD